MCARYTVLTESEIIELRLIIAEVEKQLFGNQRLSKNEIFPTNIAPVVTSSGPRPMKWGFPGINGNGVIINARIETAAEKRLFKDAIARRRCAIPATGFFEWGAVPAVSEQLSLMPECTDLKKKAEKVKYLLTLHGCPLFYLAGIYSEYALEDGRAYPHFVVLTTDANDSVSDIHDRMPVVLRDGEHISWLETGELRGISPSFSKCMA